jgi:hypothetical protein
VTNPNTQFDFSWALVGVASYTSQPSKRSTLDVNISANIIYRWRAWCRFARLRVHRGLRKTCCTNLIFVILSDVMLALHLWSWSLFSESVICEQKVRTNERINRLSWSTVVLRQQSEGEFDYHEVTIAPHGIYHLVIRPVSCHIQHAGLFPPQRPGTVPLRAPNW